MRAKACGTAPFGYERANKKLKIVPQQAAIVEEIYEQYLETHSLSAIYHYLKEKGGRTANGKTLTKQTISHILRNVTYAGKIKHKKVLYHGEHEAIITYQVFEIAQSQHQKRSKKSRIYRDHILAGIIHCPQCGYQMTPTFVNKRRDGKLKRYFYYRCQTTLKKDWSGCSVKQVSADKIESFVAENIARLLQDDGYLENLVYRWNHDHQLQQSALADMAARADFQPHDMIRPGCICNRIFDRSGQRSTRECLELAEDS